MTGVCDTIMMHYTSFLSFAILSAVDFCYCCFGLFPVEKAKAKQAWCFCVGKPRMEHRTGDERRKIYRDCARCYLVLEFPFRLIFHESHTKREGDEGGGKWGRSRVSDLSFSGGGCKVLVLVVGLEIFHHESKWVDGVCVGIPVLLGISVLLFCLVGFLS